MYSDTAEFKWDFREIRSRIRRTVFTKGIKPYFVLILIIFIISTYVYLIYLLKTRI